MRSTASLVAALLGVFCATTASAAPANDLFVNRAILTGTNLTISGNNSGAGTEAGEDTGSGNSLWFYSVWYAWTSPTNGIVHLSGATTTASFYMSIRAYRGVAFDALTLAARTPDGGVPVTAGDIIVIQVASMVYPIWGGGGGRGPFTLSLSLEVPSATSLNDTFANRQEITVPLYAFEGCIYGATSEPGEPLPSPNAGKTLWWKFTPPTTGLLTLSPAAGQFSPAMRVYQGNELESLVFVSALSELTYQMESGREYAVQMAGDYVGAGHFRLGARFYAAGNDTFGGSLQFEGTNEVVHGDTLGATFEAGEPNPGDTNTIWFSWAAPATGRVWFSRGPVWWRPMAVYTGPTVDRLAPVRLVSADNGVFCFLAEDGTVYHFQYAGQNGNFALSLQLEPFPPCANDHFRAAQVIKGENASDRRSVVGATLELGEPVHVIGLATKSVWWKWQSPVHGTISFFSERSLVPNVVLSVYQGTALEALGWVATKTNQVTFNVTGGETYFIAAALPKDVIGDVLIYWQYNSRSSASRPVLGNLLREPSWEGTGVLDAQYWQMSGSIGGSVNEPGGADGTTWPSLGGGAQIWQDFPTVPGQHHAIRFAFSGAGAQVRVSCDGVEVGVATIPADEGAFWHWAEFTAYATGPTSRIRFENLGGMFANVPMDAFSVVSLTAPPQIVNEPSSASVIAGGTAAFIVGATGSAPLAYQWFFNGMPIGWLKEAALVLESVSTNQAGTYWAVITNGFGSVTSAPVTLTVESPTKPVILWQPYGDTVAVGSYYNFSVVAAGTLPLKYQWFLDGEEIGGATNRILMFNQVDFADAGVYSVRVQNHAGSVRSLGAKLIVTEVIIGGGRIHFHNKFTSFGVTNVDAPVFEIDGATRLSGSNYLAQLYGGPSLETLRPVSQPSPFLSGFNAGYFLPQIVMLPTVPPWSNAIVQVRAWEMSKGSSYEEARALGGKFGKSALLTVMVGGDVLPPAKLDGLQSFSLLAGQPSFASGIIAFVERQPGGVVVWSHQGEPGYRYVIEKSIRGFEWYPYLVITNVTSTVLFSDHASSGAETVFYRSRILD
ncbi:MAG: hypothetical protein IH623_09700 [Verrucomicrobia bacterium]|nr:hypothetical protein [Verrucomicrobiota bacterium]